MAEEIACSLSLLLLLSHQGIPVIRSRVIRHIESALHDIPDAMARNWAGTDATAREEARHEILRNMASRLSELYTLTLHARPAIRAFGECLVRGAKGTGNQAHQAPLGPLSSSRCPGPSEHAMLRS
jgi:hypothetical protein